MSIDLREIAKTYEGRRVLDHFSLRVESGRGAALFGPSGCGKTTALRIIAGLTRPDAGEVRLAETLVDGPQTWVPPERRDVGLVFQDLCLWPHMRALRHLDFVLRGRIAARRQRLERGRMLLEQVGLADRARAYPAELSGGEQQRLAIARALACEPKTLLLDEPFANLDLAMRDRVKAVVARARDRGAAVLLATHREEDMEGLVHAVVPMQPL